MVKQYKTEWYTVYHYLLNNTRNIRFIRQLRNECSSLTDHCPYLYKNPRICPGCNSAIKEDNYHFIFKCNRYGIPRTDMKNKLQPILKMLNIKLSMKTILGFPKDTSELKNELFIRLREIIFYELGNYIQNTKRFSKPKWIMFMKSGIG